MIWIFRPLILLLSLLFLPIKVQAYVLPRSPSSSSIQLRVCHLIERRRLITNIRFLPLVLITSLSENPSPCMAVDTDENPVTPFTRETQGFSYTFTPPPNFKVSNKPLKTHLDEVNFDSQSTKGYQYGITVDPVRLQKLRQFGTPEEVAAKIVTAEVNRDGVYEVTLVRDPIEDDDGAYVIEYISDGKRGKKRFVTRTIVNNGRLYVLTVQSKEEDFTEQTRKEVYNTIETFKVIGNKA